MREYEIVYIFDSVLTEDQVNEKLEKYHQHITDSGGEITAVDHWGKRQLAYPIRKKTSGYYVVVQFTAEATVLPDLERTLKLDDDDLVRYLIVVSEGEPTAPMSIATREPREDDDDDDDEDDDEDEEE